MAPSINMNLHVLIYENKGYIYWKQSQSHPHHLKYAYCEPYKKNPGHRRHSA